MFSPRSRAARDRERLRALDRLIVRLERAGDRQRLAEAGLERAEALLASERIAEARGQFERLFSWLSAAEGPEAALIRARAEACRARLEVDYGGGRSTALPHVEAALAALEPLLAKDPGVTRLAVDLLVLRGRLLLGASQDEARRSLARAAELAGKGTGDAARCARLGARRELAVALAQEDIEAGLAELDAAEAEAGPAPIPQQDRQMLASTRAEILANGGRFAEALAVLGAASPEAPAWALTQAALTCELEGDEEGALRFGERLVELREREAEEDPSALGALAQALYAQALRTPDAEERFHLAARCRRALEDDPRGVSVEAERLLASVLELQAGCLDDPSESCALLGQRVAVLDALAREVGARSDLVERVRAWLQLGDALAADGRFESALRYYRWACEELRRWPADDPVASAVLPMALASLGQSHGVLEQHLSARDAFDEAAQLLLSSADPERIADGSSVFAFRAIACLALGDAEGAALGLRTALERIPCADDSPAELLGAAADLWEVLAEVRAEHLDQADAALAAWDEALDLRRRAGAAPAERAALLGHKGSTLDAAGRLDAAEEVFREGLALLESECEPDDPTWCADVALARLHLAGALTRQGRPREALEQVSLAMKLLEGSEPSEDSDSERASERARRQAILSFLYLQRGEALAEVGHPLLAADELTRAVELCEELADEDDGDEASYEARQRLPLALLRRARCWLSDGGHRLEARRDLRRAQRLYAGLLEEEPRPEHRRRLREVRDLQQHLGEE
ncbi:MAG: hypothetical protein D6731_20175 [Planctomycetota bacterium]|nr:MAG: hypothetical protein D6731_20175 [Planctomycetota bacterium]